MFLHMYPIPLKLSRGKNMTDAWRKNQSLWTCCICQIYGITLYGAAWADESSSAILQVFKFISAYRHSVSCLICVVHLNRHVKKYVMWKVCLLKCASLIMVFPSISVSPHPLHPPPPPSHEDPTSLGRDVLPLKLHGEFCLSPPWLPLQHATVYPVTAHRLLYLSFVSRYIFNTFRIVVQSFLRGEKSQRVFLIFSSFLCVPFFWLFFL